MNSSEIEQEQPIKYLKGWWCKQSKKALNPAA